MLELLLINLLHDIFLLFFIVCVQYKFKLIIVMLWIKEEKEKKEKQALHKERHLPLC